MKKDSRYTIKIVYEDSRPPFSFSFSRYLVIAVLAIAAGLVGGLIALDHLDIGTDQIVEGQATLERTQANLDAVMAQVSTLDATNRTFEDAVTPLAAVLDLTSESREGSVSGLTAPDLRSLLDLDAGGVDGDLSSLADLSRELDATGQLLDSARHSQEMVSGLLHEIPNAWPVGGNRGGVSMEFGPNIHPITGQWYLHKGFDIAGYPGTPILASADGIVTLAGYDPGYGFQVVVRHRFGFSTRYPHLRAITVAEGDVVEQGDMVGEMGSSGIATGTHLHFEVMLGPEVVDPAPFLMISNTFRRGGYGTR